MALLAPAGAQAGECTNIDTTIATTFFRKGCKSPVGICTAGTVPSGPLKGTTRFTALTVKPGPSPELLLYTGELVIKTRSGKVTIRDSGMLNGVTGAFLEFQQVVGGTGRFRDATGALTSQGVATGTGFSGTLAGVLCLGNHHKGHEDAEPDRDQDSSDQRDSGEALAAND
jgi:hypothetical protein